MKWDYIKNRSEEGYCKDYVIIQLEPGDECEEYVLRALAVAIFETSDRATYSLLFGKERTGEQYEQRTLSFEEAKDYPDLFQVADIQVLNMDSVNGAICKARVLREGHTGCFVLHIASQLYPGLSDPKRLQDVPRRAKEILVGMKKRGHKSVQMIMRGHAKKKGTIWEKFAFWR